METILLLDVGNTNVKIGLARPGLDLVSSYALPTGQAAGLDTSDAWGLKLLDICRVENVSPGQVTAIVASSVVPPMTYELFSHIGVGVDYLRAEGELATGQEVEGMRILQSTQGFRFLP